MQTEAINNAIAERLALRGVQSPSAGFQDYMKDIFLSLRSAVRGSNKIAFDDSDRAVLRTFDDYQDRTDALASRVATLIQNVSELVKAGSAADFAASIEDEDVEVEDRGQPTITGLVEYMLEAVDFFLDEARGSNANKEQAVARGEMTKRDLYRDANILKPQRNFEDTVDNNNSPFVPRLREKPNALTPWTGWAPPAQAQAGAASAPHPYEEEIRALTYDEHLYQKVDPAPFVPLDKDGVVWVDTESGLADLVSDLDEESVKEIAIDLENHSKHSYQGFLCLMQISTRSTDYLVDCLALRSKLGILNNIFTNPRVIKVLHGCDYDVVWLQRCLGLYLVNVFDTGRAARRLGFPSFGLAYLLKSYAGVDAQKQFQLADWRIRPLPDALERYAREDTHYLLGIYDRVKNELVDRSTPDKNLVQDVLHDSQQLCLQRYEKPIANAATCAQIIRRLRLRLDPASERVFLDCYLWRDNIARALDESGDSIMPKHVLVKVASARPMTAEAFTAAVKPIPAHIANHINELVALIRAAVEDTHRTRLSQLAEQGDSARSQQTPVQQGGSHLVQVAANSVQPLVAGVQRATTPQSAMWRASGTPSPVLSKEQLYNRAEWTAIRMPSLDEQSPSTDEPVVVALTKDSSHAASVFPATHVPASADTPSRPGNDQTEHATMDEDEETSNPPMRLHDAYSTQGWMTKSAVQLSLGYTPLGDLHAKPSELLEASRKLAEQDARAAGVEGGFPGDSEEEGQGGESDDENMFVDEEEPSTVTPDDIPQSLAQIYAISNRNRKRNKEKRRQLESDKTDISAARKAAAIATREQQQASLSGVARAALALGPNPQQSKDAEGNSEEFMRRIGWLADGQSAVPNTSAATSGSGNESSSRRGHRRSASGASTTGTDNASSAPSKRRGRRGSSTHSHMTDSSDQSSKHGSASDDAAAPFDYNAASGHYGGYTGQTAERRAAAAARRGRGGGAASGKSNPYAQAASRGGRGRGGGGSRGRGGGRGRGRSRTRS